MTTRIRSVLSVLCWLGASLSGFAATFTVTTNLDSGPGTFRQAILDANAAPGADVIQFNILPAGLKSIVPTLASGALPTITDVLTIDGTTQPGFGDRAIIELSGASVTTGGPDGLRIAANGCVIRGLVINRWRSDGIEITGNNNVVEGCLIGLMQGGTNAGANGTNGVYIVSGSNNRIGGSTAAARNVISGNNSNGIRIDGAASTGNQILGNYIGTEFTGQFSRFNGLQGVYLNQASNTRVGGANAGERNIICANSNGVVIEGAGAQGNVVMGNHLGADVSGFLDQGNVADGVRILGAPNNQIGGSGAGEGNLIIGNNASGITITGAGSTNNIVLGNRIGISPNGTGAGNATTVIQPIGVQINGGANFNIIGGTAAGAGNTIAFNTSDGIYVNAATNNAIRGNSIFSNNGLGIDLEPNNANANDIGDADTGANQLQNYPVLTSAVATPANTIVRGRLNSIASRAYEVDFFSSATNDATSVEGQQYLGTTTVTTDASGNAAFEVTLSTVATNRFITATATDPFANTSEFSGPVNALSTAPGNTFTVTTTADAGAGSLRQAILDANAGFASNNIAFAIPGAGPHLISIASVLPGLSNTMTIDGYSQAGAAVNTDASGFNGVLKIILSGTNATGADLFLVLWPGVNIRGLNLVGARVNGVEFFNPAGFGVVEGCLIGIGLDNSDQGNLGQGVSFNNSAGNRVGGPSSAQRNVISGNNNAGVQITGASATNNLIVGNFIGTSLNGLARVGNSIDGVHIDAGGGNMIGGTAVGAGNLISGNTGEGIEILTATATANIIQGNTIGADVTGAANLNNTSHGVLLNGVSSNIVGGVTPGAANLIAFNSQDGVSILTGTNNTVRGNSMRENGGSGIDLANNGLTANDTGDGDAGANQLQNFPVLTSAIASATDTTVTGTLNSGTNVLYIIDFYSNPAQENISGNGEGHQYFGNLIVTTDSNGNAPINVTLGAPATGKYICATATDPFGNTSEFSANLAALSTAPGPTFTVVNANDTGAGSLRQAILDANAAASKNAIAFAIPGGGPHLISPATALPAISNTVTIDGYTQPNSAMNSSAAAFNGDLRIILSGSNAPVNVPGLSAQWPGVTIRGLNIIAWRSTSGHGIELGPLSVNAVVEGCVIGLGLDSSARPNGGSGIYVNGSAGHRIGGALAAQRNVLSGNTGAGVLIDGATAQTNTVAGNNIGLTLDGLNRMANAQDGIRINGASNNKIGGTELGARNVISGNTGEGIEIATVSATNNLVLGNWIGPDVNGGTNFGNTSHGVYVNVGRFNSVGGIAAGAANLIAFNSGDGVFVLTGTNNPIRANLIRENGGLGIDLEVNGVTTNDIGDGDVLGNLRQNFPTLTEATSSLSSTTVRGTLSSGTNITYELDFYSNVAADATGNGEGQQFLGSTTVTTDGNGVINFNATLPARALGKFVCATATDPFGNTSEFGPCIIASSLVPSTTFQVTTTADSGPGSFRQAILDANLLFTSGDRITFVIPGTGPQIISPLTPLPTITDKVMIDAFTQSGSARNTSPTAYNGTNRVVLDGTLTTSGNGLTLGWAGVGIRGLNIILFKANGIQVEANATNCVIDGCVIGWSMTNTDVGNNFDGILLNGAVGATIGGLTPALRNVISGNNRYGIQLFAATCATNQVIGNLIGTGLTGMEDGGNSQDGININTGAHDNRIGGNTDAARNVIAGNNQEGVELNGAATAENIIIGNYIGTDVTGQAGLNNSSHGINILANAHDNQIGGLGAGEGNRIAFNTGDGITMTSGTNNAIRANSIVLNGNLGIDLSNNDVSNNDTNDVDIGPNNLQNFPVLAAVIANTNSTILRGALNSRALTRYELDFFSTLRAEGNNNNVEGDKYLGSGEVTTDAAGIGSFDIALSAVVNGRNITATATDPDGNTSEFSIPARAESRIPAPTLLVTTTADSGAGSLRQALLDAGNYFPGDPVNINFQIPGAGPHGIAPLTQLPEPFEAISLNGFSQAGASPNTLADGNNSVLKIALVGTNHFNFGLSLFTSGNIIRGISFAEFRAAALFLSGSSNRVEGCFVGLYPNGAAAGNPRGIQITPLNGGAARDNVIGGLTPAARNVISGNNGDGIHLEGSSATMVQGNFIGTDPAGAVARANVSAGVQIFNSSGNLIGGTTPAARNVIGGNANSGITISDSGSSNNRVLGNYIGTTAAGTASVPNFNGITINNSAVNTIGGVLPGEANLIAFNNWNGVTINGFSTRTNNTVRGNSIYSNGGLGINLDFDGVNENDQGDGDANANLSQNFPILISAHATTTNITLIGTLNSGTNKTYTVDFYADSLPDSTGNGEGEQYLGAVLVSTDGSGDGSFNVVLPAVIRGRFISATATDTVGNTSEFADTIEATTTFPAETLLVINTNNSGPGSLRDAILRNNMSVAGVNNLIHFNIPGVGPHVIAISEGLPPMTHPATINGFSQPGASANTLAVGSDSVLKIRLDSAPAGFAGLQIAAPHCIVRGLSITRIAPGIRIDADDALIAGCWIGLMPDGALLGNFNYGVDVHSGFNNTIGGVAPADRNVISANNVGGINCPRESSGTRILGNYIGSHPLGVEPRGNQGAGIFLSGSNHVVSGNLISGNTQGITLNSALNCRIQGNIIGPDITGTLLMAANFGTGNGIEILSDSAYNLIGGPNVADRNLISGNRTSGVNIFGLQTLSNRVVGNFIGSDITGTHPLPNLIGINVFAERTEIGGPSEAEGNLIAFNSNTGISMTGNSSTNNAIRKNRIFSNAGLGIDLVNNGVTDNDQTDGDGGPNQLQNFPVITAATIGVNDVTVTGYLESSGSRRFEIDFFSSVVADVSGYGEAQQYLDTIVVNTDGNGRADFTVVLGKRAVGRFIAATATDAANNTSEFSRAFRAGSSRPAPTLLVTNINDSGPGSLRQAMLDADAFFSATPNKINFNIPGGGERLISVASALPMTVEPVEINGFTQPGASANAGAAIDNAVRLIHLDGAGLPGSGEDGLRLASGSIIRGLIISQFPAFGVNILGSNTVVEGSLILSNRASGVALQSGSGNLVGGANVAARNIIVSHPSGNGILISGGASDNRIFGNFIGADASGGAGGANAVGVQISLGTNNLIGGVGPLEANLISANTRGVVVTGGNRNRIRGNRISASTTLGIDLGNTGITGNDTGDGDGGANLLQNFPLLASANIVAGGTHVVGVLGSGTNATYIVDFYWNFACDNSGNGEGAIYLGEISVTTDNSGNASFDRVLSGQVPRGAVTATATDSFGNTSEFSPCAGVGTEIPPQNYLVTNVNDTGAGSLRQAIFDANAAFTTGRNAIGFNIPGSGARVIAPASPLPTITGPVVINGFSQLGSALNSNPDATDAVLLVRLDGLNAGQGADGLRILANDCLVRGLIFTRFSGAAVNVSNANNVVVTENYFGVIDPAISPAAFSSKSPVASLPSDNGNAIGLFISGGQNASTTPVDPNGIGNLFRFNSDTGIWADNTTGANFDRVQADSNGDDTAPHGGGITITGGSATTVQNSKVRHNRKHQVRQGRRTNGAGGSNFTFRGNHVGPNRSDVIAPGLVVDGSSVAEISDSFFIGQRGIIGHGCQILDPLNNPNPRITGNLFEDNDGAGLILRNGFGFDIGGGFPITQNTIAHNRGGGLIFSGFSSRFTNNRFGPNNTPIVQGSFIMPTPTVDGQVAGSDHLFQAHANLSPNVNASATFYQLNPVDDLWNPVGTVNSQSSPGGLFVAPFRAPASPNNRAMGAILCSQANDCGGMGVGYVPGPLSDTTVLKTGPSSITQGAIAEFTITLSSGPNGQGVTRIVSAEDFLPSGYEYISHSVGGDGSLFGIGSDLQMMATITDEAPTVSFLVRVRALLSGTFINRAIGFGVAAGDPDAANNESSVSTTVFPPGSGPDPGAGAIVFRANSLLPFQRNTVTAPIINNGSQDATGVKAFITTSPGTLLLPAGTPFLVENNQLFLLVGTIPPGQTRLVEFLAYGTTLGNNSIGVQIRLNEPDGNALNNNASGSFQTVAPLPGPYDFGDLPNSYKTLNASDGPKHRIVAGGLILGPGASARIDAEADGQPDPNALGDDRAGVPDDEDGVEIPVSLVPGGIRSLRIWASQAGNLDFWIDLNLDGQFDPATETMKSGPGEPIAIPFPLFAGENNVNFYLPPNAVQSHLVMARFRFSTDGWLNPWGPANDGEVEDYIIRIGGTLGISLNNGAVRITYEGILQSATTPGGTYLDIPTAANPFIVPPSSPSLFFRSRPATP